ncbi:MAG: bifunctional 4-hydroxy-3-methylbut-2-enyl diphosphate reductase/30S ribosomal protein S1 [Clostridia bacterium]|nr:bifunctional 4-hydroxy-3-methylbut-2-enyl diphosphate reductase/30S ribosomal protein S1 [Clostridia bacterium]
MKVILAQNMGFCFGVRRAVEMARSQAKRPVYTYGAIIHNESVVEELKAEGIIPIESMNGLGAGDTLVVRAHGAPPALFERCADLGIEVVDATCPFVKRIHRIVERASAAGLRVFIAGKRDHPEVLGTASRAGDDRVILESLADAERVERFEAGCLVAQTTFQAGEFFAIERELKRRIERLTVYNTVCDTTIARQREAERLSLKCTKMLILGSNKSANTRALAEICKKNCQDCKTIENIGKILLEKFNADDIIGIVAGASAPDPMIREVIQGMSELENTTIVTNEAEAPAEVVAETTEPATEQQPVAETTVTPEPAVEEPAVEEPVAKTEAVEAEDASDNFEQAFEKTVKRIRPGQMITGTVLQIVDGEVFVNVGYKSDGVIPKGEFSSNPEANIDELVKVGDSVDVEVVKVNDGEGNVLLSRRNVEGKKLWDDLLKEDIVGQVFEAVGKEVIKGGMIADINGIRAFIPASQVSVRYVENLSTFVGKEMKVKILEVDRDRKRIVSSAKQAILDERAAAKKAKWEALVVGSKVQGVVRRITDFGAFVDIGGLDGLVHVTDAAWARVKKTSDVLSVGQKIEVLILNVDSDKERISLGYKQLQPKPWTLANEKYPVGTIIEGKVVRIVPFGAFVAIEPTIDGLIHISQISARRIEKVEDALKVGDVVRCKVLEVNSEAKRISLSRKDVLLEENPDLVAELEAEKAERERLYQERRAARESQREQQQGGERKERPERRQRPQSDSSERRESRPERRRRSEDADYELPPVESATTSLKDLFANYKPNED